MRIAALSAAILAATTLSGPALAQMPDKLSKPEYTAPAQTVPDAQDIPYPGVMTLKVDARDNAQGVFNVIQTIPVAKSGRFTLLYPEWLPGNHAPRGEIEKVAGLEFSANGQSIPWVRDDVEVYAFHLDIPEGVTEITAKFDFTSATDGNQGRIVMAPSMLNLRWHQVSFYPAGYYIRQIPVQATAIYPDGWQAASAAPVKSQNSSTVVYEEIDYDTLVDSPVFAGKYFQKHKLSNKVDLNIVADDAKYLKPKRDHLAKHSKLVKEAVALFGGQQYDRYDFLLALTEEMGGIGLEHHRSSENGVNREYFTDWDKGPGRRNLLPHELVHSWNGKYRRPEGIWTPDFREPMRDNLLWVYEGQTQFWGYVLGARSGLFSKQDTLDAFAAIAAAMDLRTGRTWRPLVDTTHDPILAKRQPKPWSTWQRQEDYYNEGLLIWLEADQIIRRDTGGKKSLENFAKDFFAGKEGDYGVKTYTREDVVAALNRVHPYDWADFIETRVYRTTREAPKNGLTLGGYQLAYGKQQSAFLKSSEQRRKNTDLSYSLGISVDTKGEIKSVVWGSPAFKAGMKDGLTISAIGGKAFSVDALKQAIEDAEGKTTPIEIFAKDNDAYKNFLVDYSGGHRYPRLEKISIQIMNTGEGAAKNSGAKETGIDRLLKPRTK